MLACLLFLFLLIFFASNLFQVLSAHIVLFQPVIPCNASEPARSEIMTAHFGMNISLCKFTTILQIPPRKKKGGGLSFPAILGRGLHNCHPRDRNRWWPLLWGWSNLIGKSFWSVGLKCPFPYEKIVPLFCILLPRTITKMYQMYCSIGHMEFPKFQTRIFVEWKALIKYFL